MKLNRGLPIIIYDYETAGDDPYRCQLVQIGAIVIDSRTLKPKKGGEFNIEVCPIIDDDKAIAAGYQPVQDKALQVNGKTREGLMNAPNEKVAWESFKNFCKKFNPSGDSYRAPIPAGYNINGFDQIITRRMCQKYGPTDKNGSPTLFNKIYKFDLMDMVFGWMEFSDDVQSISLTNMMEYFGFDRSEIDGAHDALNDVKITANILIKFLKFQRNIAKNTTFGNAFSNGERFV